MKLSDIVNLLGHRLPFFTNKFSESLGVDIVSATIVDGVVTVITSAPHTLNVGAFVSVTQAQIYHTVSSLTRVGRRVTVVLEDDHDLTEGWQTQVEISGATPTEYNGIFTLLTVPNRRTFTYEVSNNSLATPATGTIKFKENLERGVAGHWAITSVTSTSFTFSINNLQLAGDVFALSITRSQRIMGVVSLERFLEEYSKQKYSKYWAVVTLEDATTSKDRTLFNDSNSLNSGSSEMRQLLLEPFSVYVVCPCESSYAGAKVTDDMWEEVRNAILRSLLGAPIPTGLASTSYSGVTFLGHKFAGFYNGALYVHEFKFETIKEITQDDGILGDVIPGVLSGTRAFRDTYMRFDNGFGESVMDTKVNLDDEPL